MINPLVTLLMVFLIGVSVQTPVPGLTLVGRGRVSATYDIEAVPPYAFALESGILNVLDVRNPAAVREVGSLAFDRGRSRTALRFPYLYLTGFNEPLAIIDISTPTRPRWVAEFPELGPTASGGFELAGDVAYSVRIQREPGQPGELFLDVLDLAANPIRPARTGTINLGVRVQGEYGGIAQADGRVFVLVRRPLGAVAQSQLIVVDARVPARPTIERAIAFPEGALYRNLEIRGDLIYLAQTETLRDPRAGLAIHRLAANGDLERLGEALAPDLAIPIDLIVRDDVVYMTFKVGGLVATFDVANPRAPRLVDRYQQNDSWSAGLGMSLVEDRLYVTGDNGPSPIFDVRTARTPRLMGRHESEGGSVDRVSVDGKLVTLRSLTDLIFYDVSDAGAPRRVSRHNGPIPAYDLTKPFNLNMVADARGGRAVVAYESLVAQILDVRAASAPRVLATFTSRGLVHAIAQTPAHVILGHETRGSGSIVSGGIQVVALRTGGEVETVGSLDVERPPMAMATHGSRLVTLSADGTLTVVDLGTPTRPVLQGRIATAGSGPSRDASGPWNLALSEDGRRAYVTRAAVVEAAATRTGRGVLAVIDLQVPTAPRIIAQLEIVTSGDTAIPLAVSGLDVMLLAGSSGGVVIVDVRNPGRPVVSGVYALPSFIYPSDIAVDREHIYIGAGEDGLLIFRRPA
jgi:hypothetical protein